MLSPFSYNGSQKDKSQQFMNNSPIYSFQLFSPLLQQATSPFLSPFPHSRKISDDLSDLLFFKLEHDQNRINIQQSQPLCSKQQNELLIRDFFVEGHGLPAEQEDGKMISTLLSKRGDMPLTRFQTPQIQHQPPFLLLASQSLLPSIKNMVEFLVQNSKLSDDQLNFEAKRFHELGNATEQIFKILASKFCKLKKTKEELTKYCMRKAFKYVSERSREVNSNRSLEGSMRQYFANEKNAQSFNVPFKKNSAQKTMNCNFLRRVFSCPRFAADYQIFLRQFRKLIEQDNEHKVDYLVGLIEQAMKQGNFGKIGGIRRLPWTREILDQTNQLAILLPEEGNGRKNRRNQ